jgi:hypothetical protein
LTRFAASILATCLAGCLTGCHVGVETPHIDNYRLSRLQCELNHEYRCREAGSALEVSIDPDILDPSISPFDRLTLVSTQIHHLPAEDGRWPRNRRVAFEVEPSPWGWRVCRTIQLQEREAVAWEPAPSDDTCVPLLQLSDLLADGLLLATAELRRRDPPSGAAPLDDPTHDALAEWATERWGRCCVHPLDEETFTVEAPTGLPDRASAELEWFPRQVAYDKLFVALQQVFADDGRSPSALLHFDGYCPPPAS